MPGQANGTLPLRILVIDDEANIRVTLSLCLEAEGHTVVGHGTIDDALEEIARQAFDLIFLDLRLGMKNGMDYIPQLVHQNPWTRIVVITAYASVDSAVEAMKRGASDYLPKPFDANHVLLVTRNVAERRQLERKIEALQTTLGESDLEEDFPTAEPAVRNVLDLAKQVARSRASLIIQGEIGTGKSRLARAVHAWSDRAMQPFAAITCRADVDALQTELFGSNFSSKTEKTAGKVEFCDGGTLLLEEIGELPLVLQPNILRLVKDKEFERPEDATRRRTDVRIIATTSSDLQDAVVRGKFRQDLLLAINVVQIDVPPLRNRPADISLLADRYLALLSHQNQRKIAGFTPEAAHVLTKHSWPGNVRELRNLVERAVLLCRADLIGVEHLPPNLLGSEANVTIGDLVPLSLVEELHVRRVVNSARSLRQAATILGIDSGTVVRRMKRYGAGDDQPAA